MRSLVVVPTYQEAANIPELLHRFDSSAPDTDLLIVDDASPDGTAALARQLGAEVGRVQVVERPGKGGLGSAYRFGFAIGVEQGYEIILQMDADLSHDPADVPRLIAAIEEIPITFTDRVRGRSKMSGAVMWEELIHVTAWGVRDRWARAVAGRGRGTPTR
jgi:dolichol-phosphate mannosyltransferase